MYRIIQCITQEHDYILLGVAALVCIAGSMLTVMTLRRLIGAKGARRRVQFVLSGFVMGATVYSTHFIAMLAYDPGVEHGYEPVLTALSFAVAIGGAMVTNLVIAYSRRRLRYIHAGLCFGITVSIMHYLGMEAYQLPGVIVWKPVMVFMSMVFGACLGVATFHRIMFPVTGFCWLGGAVFMVFSIFAMHFTGMSAIEIRLDSLIIVPQQLLSDPVLGMLMFAIVTLVLFVGFSSISIETSMEQEAFHRIEHTLAHDHLTGLPNRFQLKERLLQVTEAMEQNGGSHVAIVTIDLDLFKEVNDIHGHEIGDLVLREIARRLRSTLSVDEFVARVGGDEFIAIKTDMRTPASAMTFAKSLLKRITPPVQIGQSAIVTGASIGVATSVEDGCDMDDLLQKSGMAMFRAKQDPDLQVCLYDAEMDQKHREELHLVNDLRNALGRDEFELVYQLQNDAKSREVVGCEALLRWHHPTRGLISPAIFIPLAEEAGLISDIGRWVMRTACAEAATWSKPLSVAVNVAPQQLGQANFISDLARILRETGLDPARLELEVTEASVIHDQAYALKVLKQVKHMGVRIAMDDFGTGYSSLATLQAFPFDKIKIDRSFVTDLHKDHHRAAIVRSTLSLGEAFDIPVLAEGVESEDELRHLDAEGCHYVQGYFFGKPMHVDMVRALFITSPVASAS